MIITRGFGISGVKSVSPILFEELEIEISDEFTIDVQPMLLEIELLDELTVDVKPMEFEIELDSTFDNIEVQPGDFEIGVE